MLIWLIPVSTLIIGVVLCIVVWKMEHTTEATTSENDTEDMTVGDAIEKLLAEQAERYEKKLADKEVARNTLSSQHSALVEKQAAQLNQSQGDLNAASAKRYAAESEKAEMISMIEGFISQLQDKWAPPVYEEHDFAWAMKQVQEGKKVECAGTVYFIDSTSTILKEATTDYARGLYDVRDSQRISTQPGALWSIFEEEGAPF